MSLYDIFSFILTNHSIDELGLLPCIPDKTELPQHTQQYHPLVVYDSKLGIGLESIVVLLKEAQERLLSFQLSCDMNGLKQASEILVLLKPDHYTSMNIRKKLIQTGQINPIDELNFINLIFTIPRNTKSSIAWHHRKWIYQYQFKKEMINELEMEQEIKLCERCIQLHPRNYYAWEYRYWFITTFFNHHHQKVIKNEYEKMLQWIEKNVSDHSGISYLEHILTLLTTEITTATVNIVLPTQGEEKEGADRFHFKTMMQSHLNWLNQLILSFEGHETLWCHRRFCAFLWINKSNSSFSSLSTWFINQHDFIKHSLLHLNTPSHSLSKHQERQLILGLKCGLWLCLLEKRQANDIQQTKINQLMDNYIEQLQSYDATPIYSIWKSTSFYIKN
ncbi:unnamed protein product [Cunninghamella blakesleeana]